MSGKMKNFCKYFWPSLSTLLIMLALTVGFLFLINYNGVFGHSYISGYNFIGDNSKQVQYLDIESAELLDEGKSSTGAYASKMLILSERQDRNASTESWCIVLEAVFIVLVLLLVFDLSVSILKFFPFYRNSMKIAQKVVKIFEFVLSIVILIGIKELIINLEYFGQFLSVGISCYILPIISLIGAVCAFIFDKINNKKDGLSEI